MPESLQIKRFSDIDINEPFFSSLKDDYREFPQWFKGKSQEPVFVHYIEQKLSGFMYLKIEDSQLLDITPIMPKRKRIKIGTLKVNPHGTKLGERFVKKALDFAIKSQTEELYLTTFPKHKALINLIEEFGFSFYGTKTTGNGVENVYLKYLDQNHLFGNLRKDYPLVDTRKANAYLLAIKPEWHTKLFPDSILASENYDSVQDVSYTNSISKSYICFMSDVAKLAIGDIIVIYRMKDDQGPAEYRSVVTSLCTVESVRSKSSFGDFGAFSAHCLPFSVFNETELQEWWVSNKKVFVIKMLYNIALTRRLIRKSLIENIGLSRDVYWGFMPLSKQQFLDITQNGGVDGRLIIH